MASSRIRILVSFRTVRARHTSCLWPTLQISPKYYNIFRTVRARHTSCLWPTLQISPKYYNIHTGSWSPLGPSAPGTPAVSGPHCKYHPNITTYSGRSVPGTPAVSGPHCKYHPNITTYIQDLGLLQDGPRQAHQLSLAHTANITLWHFTFSDVICLHGYNVCRDGNFIIFWKLNAVAPTLYYYCMRHYCTHYKFFNCQIQNSALIWK